MKKFLLSLACVLGMASIASAQTVLQSKDATDIQGEKVTEETTNSSGAVTGKNVSGLKSLKIGEYSFTFEKGTAGTATAYYYPRTTVPDEAATIRCYNGSTMTITCPAAVTQIDFKGTNGTAGAAHTANVGTISDVTKTAMTWKGDASSITITFKSNFRITEMTVYTQGETPVEPEKPTVGTGEGTEASPFDVVRAKAYADAGFTDSYYIEGTVVSVETSDADIEKFKNLDYNISNDGTAEGQMLVFRGKYFNGEAFTVENKLKAGDKVVIQGSLSTHNGAGQVGANSKLIKLNGETGGETPTPEGTVVTSLKAAKALAKDTKYVLNCEPVVVYSNGQYTYVYDGESYALLYKANLGVNVGDKLKSGSTGKISIYNNLIELVPDAVEANGTGTVPSPEVIPAEDLAATLVAANQDDYIVIKDITFAAANVQEGTVDVDGSPLTVKVYNRFGVPAKEGKFDMTGFIAVFNTDVQVYIVELKGESKPVELLGTGEGTLESPYDCVRANDIVKNGLQTADEVYVKGKVVSIKTTPEEVAQYGNLNYYISNDGTETDQFYVYRGYYFDGEKFTSLNQLTAGCTVVVKGKLTAFNQSPQMDKGNQIITLEGLEGVDSIVVDDSNAPVEYFNLQGVRVAEPTTGLYIRRQGSKTTKVIL